MTMGSILKKRNLNYVLGLLLLTACVACEKVIDLNLNNADPVIVIDGGINDLVEVQAIRVSKTYKFTDPNHFNGVKGAKVSLKGSDGSTINYLESSTPGLYQTTKLRGRYGVTYTMTVTSEGQTYTASSKMPARVALESLTFKELNFSGRKRNYIVANYTDPKGIENQYLSTIKVKGKVEYNSASEDRFNDGNKISDVLFYQLDDLSKGDTLAVELRCIDRAVFKYFYSLGQNTGNGQPVAPANPPTNLSNGALGIFSAHTSSTRKATIK